MSRFFCPSCWCERPAEKRVVVWRRGRYGKIPQVRCTHCATRSRPLVAMHAERKAAAEQEKAC